VPCCQIYTILTDCFFGDLPTGYYISRSLLHWGVLDAKFTPPLILQLNFSRPTKCHLEYSCRDQFKSILLQETHTKSNGKNKDARVFSHWLNQSPKIWDCNSRPQRMIQPTTLIDSSTEGSETEWFLTISINHKSPQLLNLTLQRWKHLSQIHWHVIWLNK